MSQSQFLLFAIPLDVWSQSALKHQLGADIIGFVGDAAGCERRMAKGVNLENEQSRYRQCCQRLEQEIVMSRRGSPLRKSAQQWGVEFATILGQGYFPMLELPPGYLDLLSHVGSDSLGPKRLGASFYAPDEVGEHRAAFSDWTAQNGFSNTACVKARLAFLDAAARAGCGIVETQSAFHPRTPTREALQPASVPVSDPVTIQIPDFARDGLAVESLNGMGRKQKLAENLMRQITESFRTGDPVGFGNQAPHDVIVEVLNQLAFVPGGDSVRQAQIRVVYADGTEAAPFPLLQIKRLPASVSANVKPLRAALMSMRHPELDPEIDFCWFRNREVSRTRTLAETDAFCYQSSLDQLRACLELGPFRLSLYHTGFEPAVIGFYRALSVFLRDPAMRSIGVHVTPFYFRGVAGYQSGTEWF